MKKLKDIFYDMNDILVALVIIAIAAFVIVGKINDIMDYPSTLAAEIKVPEEKQATNYAENPQTTSQGAAQSNDTQGTTQGNDSENNAQSSNSKTPVNYSVYIDNGASAEKIADILISVGLVDSRKQFYSAVTTAGAEEKLRAGNFIIPSDATPDEVVEILTK
jgi:YceG-like family.